MKNNRQSSSKPNQIQINKAQQCQLQVDNIAQRTKRLNDEQLKPTQKDKQKIKKKRFPIQNVTTKL